MTLADELIATLEPRALEHGLELVTVMVTGGTRHRTVSVYLDREGGIDIETVAGANEWVAEALDRFPRLSGSYTLEVSSPGIERFLRTRAHFERFAGERATVDVGSPIDGRSRFTGVIIGLADDDVVIDSDDKRFRLPFDVIERARLKADFNKFGERDGDDS